jgi:phosphoglucomutase
MSNNPLAGKPAPRDLLTNIPQLVAAYYTEQPDPAKVAQQVSFGTSGHRGTSTAGSFNETHILAVCQAICEYRQQQGTTGPLFMGKDTHALSEPAEISALEVFAANGVEVRIAKQPRYTATPLVSHAILTYNRGRQSGLADGVVITPSHNPPADGGIKYNGTNGGPAGPEITGVIQKRANQILQTGLRDVRRLTHSQALQASNTQYHDFLTPYVQDLQQIIEMDHIAASGIRIGVDPMGGAAVDYWDVIADVYKLNITVVNRAIDPAFSFMTLDHDGKIRMDCSSPSAMASLIRLRSEFDIAFGNDPDVDRHGIVTPSSGLLNPNHYLAVAIWYLFKNRPGWPANAKIGKTLVSSSLIDRVARDLGRELAEVPVGFKWFVDGLQTGEFGFGGEESAGASFLRKDGSVWTTDKDGILLNLLAAEITATTGRDPGLHYQDLVARLGSPLYKRIDAYANSAQKKVLQNLDPSAVQADQLAGETIVARLTRAPGNRAAIGGLKVVTENGWFAARPSGTEDIYKIYAESFVDQDHLSRVINEAQDMVSATFKLAGV